MILEQSRLRLGFIALTDCAPGAVAKACGLFEAEGLDLRANRARTPWGSRSAD